MPRICKRSDPARRECITRLGTNSWQTITIPESMELSPGMLVILCDDTIWSPADYETLKTAEIHHVQCVDGTVVTLSDRLLHTYEVGNNATITAIEPIEIQYPGSRSLDHLEPRRHMGLGSIKPYHPQFKIAPCPNLDTLRVPSLTHMARRFQTARSTNAPWLVPGMALASQMQPLTHWSRPTTCGTVAIVSHSGDYTRGQSRGVAVTNNIFTTGIHAAIDSHPQCEDILISGNKNFTRVVWGCDTDRCKKHNDCGQRISRVHVSTSR